MDQRTGDRGWGENLLGFDTEETTALNVLTTKELPEQSRELVDVTVDSKIVLVPSSGSAKTGCSVV